jgi:hypothetical protein
MSVTRTLRDQLAEIERSGLAIAGVRFGKHLKINVAAPDGRTMLLVVSRSPSDWRVQRKFNAQLRKFAREGARP